MIVAGLLRHLAADQIARGLKVEHENLRLQQRRLDRLALAGFLAFEQRGEDAERGEQAGGQIGNRNADPQRPVTGQAGDRHQAAHALSDLIEARPIRIGPILAEAGNARIDQARIDLAQRFVIDAEALLHGRAEILDQYVRLLDQALEGGEPLRRFQIERHTALVAMQVLKIRSLAWSAHRLIGIGRRLDFDDVGAPIGELARAGRPGPHPRQVEHGEARKRF